MMLFSSIVDRLAQPKRGLTESLFAAAILATIGITFFIAWLQARRQDPSPMGGTDIGEWLLRVLAILALAVVAAFLWLTLRLHR
jgi:hypothetical protein